jgi:hypothetical protein
VTKVFLKKLMQRDPHKRLGHPDQGGTMAIRDHPFFKEISFFDIYLKKIPPPIVPYIQCSDDLSNFDNILPSMDKNVAR